MKELSEDFHFCKEQPPQSFYENLQLTNRLSEEQYQQLLETVFGFLSKPVSADEFSRKVEAFTSKHGIKLNPVKEMIKTILIIVKEATRRRLTPGQLFGDLQKLKQEPDKASKLTRMWGKSVGGGEAPEEGKVPDVSVLAKRLVNLEWKFAVTSSNSEINRVGNCFIQIKMILSKGLSTESVLFEMSLHQFYDFMHQMEKAKLELDSNA